MYNNVVYVTMLILRW